MVVKVRLNEAVSQRLANLLSERNMTQYELFKKSGVPRSTIGNVINCSYDSVKLRIIQEISLGFDMSITDFFNSPLFDINNIDD